MQIDLGSYPVHLITGIFAIIMSLIVCSILFYSYFKSKSTPTLLLATAFSLFVLWSFGSILYPILTPYELAYTWMVIPVYASYIGFYIIFH